jgi:predicted enzyme related to lactoylglutathione lyase
VALDLFAGIPVSDYARALLWYERLFGSAPTFVASATEAVWEVAEHRSVVIEERPEHAGHAMHTIFVNDLEALVEQIARRGLSRLSVKPTPMGCGRRPTGISPTRPSG